MSKVEFKGSKEIYIGENKRSTVSFVRITPDLPAESYTNHHILLADVSGSMSGNIQTLKERIVLTLKALQELPDSYVSIITYSGHNQSKRIITGVKAEEKAYIMADIWNVLEEELYAKSVTVISEPLEQSIKICTSLASVCSKHHVALFTDGCLVPTMWDEKAEREKCCKVAEICGSEGIFLNAVGFGQYYDRAFLKELVTIAGNGSLVHIDEVKDYYEVILNIIKKVNAQKQIALDISTREGLIFNLGSSVFKPDFNIRSSNTDSFMFAAIDTSSIQVDGNIYEFDSGLQATDSGILDDFYYSLARYYLIEEDIDNMEFIIKALGDISLFAQVQNCYSFIEKGNAVKTITSVLEDSSKRFLRGRNPIIEAADEKLCILEILQSILEDPNSELLWDIDTPYHRITQHTSQIEDSITFKRKQTALLPVTGITIGSEKLNIGVKVRINGEVSDSITGFKKEACIYRDFNIINSGNINVPYIYARLSFKLLKKFMDQDLVDAAMQNPDYAVNVFRINLQGIKSTNKRVLKSMTMSEIAENLLRIAELKCKQWAFNQHIKELTSSEDKLSFMDASKEEQEIRRILRIDSNGIYSPAAISKDNDAPFEIYPAVFLTWDILKYPEKKTKEHYLNAIKEEITNKKFKSHMDNKDIFDYLTKELSLLRTEMRYREFRINAVRIASAITGKSPFLWEEAGEKSKTCTDKVLNRNMVVGGKMTFCRKTIDGNTIEQQKWVQLIKCN